VGETGGARDTGGPRGGEARSDPVSWEGTSGGTVLVWTTTGGDAMRPESMTIAEVIGC